MYYTCGPEECLQDLLALGSPFMDSAAVDASALRSAYLAYLTSRQPEVPRALDFEPVFVEDRGTIGELARIFGLDDTPAGKVSGYEALRDPGDPVPDWKLELLSKGYGLLVDFEPALGSLFSLAVDSIFSTANSLAAGSMTTGRAMGIVWVDPLKGWSAEDVAEAYAHELTHTLLTLDEHRFGHFSDYEDLREPSNMARSAIRSELRPLNAVIHSYVVAAELLQFRSRLLPGDFQPRLHTNTEILSAKALEAGRSIRELPNLDELTTPRLRSILDRTDRSLDALADQSPEYRGTGGTAPCTT